MNGDRRVPLIAFAVIGLLGCGPTTTDARVALEVGIETAPEGIVVIATGNVCKHDLSVSAKFDAQQQVITLVGEGSIPENELDYCERYIDTGGSGVEPVEWRKLVVAPHPGVYLLRSAVGSDQVEFEVADDGEVTSSDPFPTLALLRERQPDREATIALATRLLDAWNLPDADSSVRCDLDDDLDTEIERYHTSCRILTPVITLDAGLHPIPVEALDSIGCLERTETDPVDVNGGWELTCPVAVNGREVDLHISGNHNVSGREGMEPGWRWAGGFKVWISSTGASGAFGRGETTLRT
ncbi:MAG: hypothetical protein WCC60_15990 [Ilumatobacteraceae bacterium]